jgi:hypothetical protein
LLIDTTVTISDEPIAFEVSNLKPICEDKVHEYTFKVKGKAPWLLAYNNGNITNTFSISDTLSTWTCAPGNYYFKGLNDANNCTLALSRNDTLSHFIEQAPVLTTNYTHIGITPTTYPILWYLNGLLLDSLQYKKPSIQILQEGTYNALIRDATGCIWESDSITIEFPNNIAVYPNPFTNFINVAINEDFGTYWQMEVFDIMGQTIFESKTEKPFLNWTCAGISSGVYTLKISFQNNSKPVLHRILKR